MPPAAESLILLYVLLAVLASVPVAVLLKHFVWGEGAVPGMPPLPELGKSGSLTIPMRPWGREDAWFAVALALAVAALMGPVVAVLASGDKSDGELEIEFTAEIFAVQIFAQGLLITLVIVWVVMFRRFDPWLRFGLSAQPVWKAAALATLWLLMAYMAVAVVSTTALPALKELTGLDLKQQPMVENAPDISDPITRVLMVITLCVGAPIMEELIFRGVLYSVAARFIHPVYACVASAVLFGVIHGNLLSLIPLSVLGILLAEAYRRTGSLLVPIFMHAGFNLISFLVLTQWPELAQR